MEPPIKTDLAHLVANQVIISVDESVHVTVKTLKAVHGFNVKLYFSFGEPILPVLLLLLMLLISVENCFIVKLYFFLVSRSLRYCYCY